MRELKRKVNILSGFYIDFERCCICASSEPHEEINLTQQEIKILRFLCLQSDNESNGYVTNEQIFEYLYGRPYADVEYEPIDIRAYVLYSADEENIESYDSFCFETAEYRYFEGGHFFIHEHCDEMASFINKTISVNTRVRV